MASRRLTDLCRAAYKKAELLVCELDKLEFQYVVACTLRYPKEQAALYAQGRNELSLVNAMRKQSDLPPITEDENKRRVTWAIPGTSLHEKGAALDIYPLVGGKLAPDTSSQWKILGELGEAAGFEWGGRWTRRDLPHFQLRKEDLAHA